MAIIKIVNGKLSQIATYWINLVGKYHGFASKQQMAGNCIIPKVFQFCSKAVFYWN